MAGIAWPKGFSVKVEAPTTLNGYRLREQTNASGLFDGMQANEWNTAKVAYWDGDKGVQYVDVTFANNVNIWRCGTTGWSQYYAPLQIQKYNPMTSNFEIISDTYSLPCSSITKDYWEMFVKGLPPGRYRFVIVGAGNYRLDSEWYVENLDSSEYKTLVGEQLTSPQNGWKRIEDTDPNIIYTGTFSTGNSAGYSNGSMKYGSGSSLGFKFKFVGTKLRIISTRLTSYSDTISVKIDGIDHTFSQKGSSLNQCVTFEKTGLENTAHEVTVVNMTNDFLSIDAVDIDGMLLHPYLTERTSLADMEIGDIISCEYVAASGATGAFSKLGAATKAVLPSAPVAAPDGAFYFIKVREGLLIADRVIQHSIAWTTLNAARLIEGRISVDTIIPIMTSNTAPSGRAFADSYFTNSGSFEPFRAFDGLSATMWSSASTAVSDASPFKFGYEFPTPTVIRSYSIQSSPAAADKTYSLKSWYFEGSNNGSSWDVLHTVANEPIWGISETRSYSFNNSTAYKMYRFRITANQGGGYIVIASVSMLTASSQFKIRALSGGVAWADANSNFSTTNQSKGCFPTINEWDSYVLGSTLDGKISNGDVGIWNLAVPVSNICIETSVDGVTQTDGSTASASTRVLRGRYNASAGFDSLTAWGTITTAYPSVGFRPVMEYVDSKLDKSKRPSTLWY